ncbi:MAG: hypothetical protein JXA24_07400 [Proteobacteria bacterium]|nr:hypothetical protein [Pseudomonadota bacterium]
MKRIAVAVMALALLAACGGSGGGGTPTTTATKAAAEAAIEATISAGGEAVLAALNPGNGAQVVKEAFPIDNTPVSCDGSGTYTPSGTVNANCVEGATSITCTITDAPVQVVFNDCAKTVTIEGTTYNEVLNGTASTNVTGTITGSEATGATINGSGTLSGTVTLTGDAAGTADLDAVTWTATGSIEPSPTIGCDGTAVVTIDGQVAENCEVASDCKGCEQ